MEDKKTIRAEFKKKIIEDRAYKDALINCNIYGSDIYQSAEEIFLFYGKGSEPDLGALARNALIDGKKVAYPVTISDSGMIFRYISDFDNDFVQGAFGIFEPKDILPEADYTKSATRIILCPGVAFSDDGYRLGHGKGYYDRFLQAHGTDFATVAGVSYSDCIIDNVPHEDYDCKMDYILTEQGWF